MKNVLDFYEEKELNNNLLYLSYIVTDNVESIILSHTNCIKVIPKTKNFTMYNSILLSFESYVRFYDNLKEEGEFKNEIKYFKEEYKKLSFFMLYNVYKSLRSFDFERKGNSYSEEYNTAAIEANDFLSKLTDGDVFVVPLKISGFYKKHKDLKYKEFIKEAKKVSSLSSDRRLLDEMFKEL